MTRQHTEHSRLAPIVQTLTESTVCVKPTGHAQWRVELSNGCAHGATARLVDDWFVVDLPLGGGRAHSRKRHWRMMAINAGIDGALEFALGSDEPRPCGRRSDRSADRTGSGASARRAALSRRTWTPWPRMPATRLRPP